MCVVSFAYKDRVALVLIVQSPVKQRFSMTSADFVQIFQLLVGAFGTGDWKTMTTIAHTMCGYSLMVHTQCVRRFNDAHTMCEYCSMVHRPSHNFN